MNRALFFICTIWISASCKDTSKTFIVQKETISIELPGYVEEEELVEDGIIEYANRYRNFYIVALKVDANSSIDSVSTQSLHRLTTELEDKIIDTLNTDNGKEYKIQGYFKGEKEPIFYYHKITENAKDRYAVTVWTRGEERLKKYEDNMKAILKSIKVSEK